jgi:hypothetical protein
LGGSAVIMYTTHTETKQKEDSQSGILYSTVQYCTVLPALAPTYLAS